MFFELKITKKKIQLEGTGNDGGAMRTDFFIAVGVLPVELLAHQVSMVSASN